MLTKQAAKDSPITYGDLSRKIGIHHRAIRYVLGVIQDDCMTQELPPLPILAVNEERGVPGTGFIACDRDDLDRGRDEVHAFPRATLENPFRYAADGTAEDELVQTLVNDPESGSDVFKRVKVPGNGADNISKKGIATSI